MSDALKQAIENLYLAFRTYEIGDPKEVSCFEYGPTPEEISGVSRDLRNIPDSTLNGVIFYNYGWDYWGSKNEVGYFLPRLMEYFADDVARFELGGLFKFKLGYVFSDTNDDWTDEEKESLRQFITVLLQEHLSIDNDVGYLIECGLMLSLTPEYILSIWKSDKQLHKKQVVALFEHFSCPVYAESTPIGRYFKSSATIEVFLDLLFEQLTLEEVIEIC